MAKVLINQSTLTSIANAIRTKNGLTREYKPSEMPAAILAIAGSGGGGYYPGGDLESYISKNLTATYLYIPAEYADEDGTLYVGKYGTLSSLQKLEFGEGIVKIVYTSSGSTSSLNSFSNLTNCKIVFPSTLKEINGQLFSSFTPKDGTLEFPEGFEAVENGAFSNIKESTIILPSTIKRIGSECFSAYKDYNYYTSPTYNFYIKGKPDIINFDTNAFFNDYDAGALDGKGFAVYQNFFVSWSKSALTIPTAFRRTITYNYGF